MFDRLLPTVDYVRKLRRQRMQRLTVVPMSRKSVLESSLRKFRRTLRPAILALLRAMPSPEKCGCQARKEWIIRQIEAI
jgi:hypothetical protein